MFLTHCVMGWTVLTALGLFLPVWTAVKVIQPYKVVSVNGTAKVQCLIQPQPSHGKVQPHERNPRYPYPYPEEVRVTLLKGLHDVHELCSSILNFTQHRETGGREGGEVQCSFAVSEGAINLSVSGLNAADTDLYRCQIEVLYPPPYLRLCGNATLIHVPGSSDCPVQGLHTEVAHLVREEEEGERREPISAPVVILVTLVMVVLLAIIYLQTLQCKRGKREKVMSVSGGYCVDAQMQNLPAVFSMQCMQGKTKSEFGSVFAPY